MEKLKKGMSAEESIEEETAEQQDEKSAEKEKENEEEKENSEDVKYPELKIKKIKIQTKKPEENEQFKDSEIQKWPIRREEEGQLAIDVYQTEKELVVQSAIAGIKAGNLDIGIEKDILTIKGSRKKPTEEKSDYFVKECFWGFFSREIILPVEVDPGKIKAEIKNGILTIRMPKIIRDSKRKIVIKE